MAGLTDDEKVGLSEEEIKALEEPDEPEVSLDESSGDDDKDSEGEEKEVTDDKKADDVDEESKDEEKVAKDEEKLADTRDEQKEKPIDQAAAQDASDPETKPTEEPKAEEPKKEDAVNTPAPPFVKLGIVEQTEINKLNEDVEDLRKQFDDGEIEYDVLMQKQREVDKIVLKNEMAQEINEQSRQGTWRWQQEMFFANNPDFIENQVVNLAFSGIVNQLIHSGDADKMTDAQLLSKAKGIVEEGIGGKGGQTSEGDEILGDKEAQEAKAKADAIKTAKAGAADKNKIPATLKDIPAAESQESDDKWAYLDKLDGDVYQSAIDKLLPTELEQYAMAR